MVRFARPSLSDKSADEFRESADGVAYDQQVQEVEERHVVVGQHQGSERAPLVIEVIEGGRRESDRWPDSRNEGPPGDSAAAAGL